MKTHTRKTIVQGVLLALVFILGMSGTSQGAEFWFRAETMLKSMPSTSDITMWGFAQCSDGTYTVCGPATVPGPRLTVPVGDPVLTINLRNNLTGPFVEPVSIVIPGQTAVMSPVKITDGSGRQRVTSFTAETPPDNSTTIVYSWTNMRPGTYLYESGTHPAVQVQMGLYGAVTKDAAAGQAYGATTAYASEAILLFSEIDPVLHGHVAGGTYGTPPPTGITSTMTYEPKYFLINGSAYSAATSTPIAAGNAGSRTLVRLLNAGLKNRVPTLTGLYLSLVAEDGNPYAFPKEQYSLLLSPGKTMDALIMPAVSDTYAVFDRRLGLTNGATAPGGMLAYLAVGALTSQSIGVFREGQWFLDLNNSQTWDSGDLSFVFGFAGDKPVVGDWSGSGTTKIGVLRGNEWLLDVNGNGAWDTGIDRGYVFGNPGDIPVTGNWSGSGATKIGVFRSGAWYLDMNGNGAWEDGIDAVYSFGIPSDIPVTGDWNGSGTTKIGVFRSGAWYLDMNGNGVWEDGIDAVYSFGISTDKPVVGDWSGSGTSKIGVVRGSAWFVDTSGNGAWDQGIDGIIPDFGIPGDVPLTGRW